MGLQVYDKQTFRTTYFKDINLPFVKKRFRFLSVEMYKGFVYILVFSLEKIKGITEARRYLVRVEPQSRKSRRFLLPYIADVKGTSQDVRHMQRLGSKLLLYGTRQAYFSGSLQGGYMVFDLKRNRISFASRQNISDIWQTKDRLFASALWHRPRVMGLGTNPINLFSRKYIVNKQSGSLVPFSKEYRLLALDREKMKPGQFGTKQYQRLMHAAQVKNDHQARLRFSRLKTYPYSVYLSLGKIAAHR